MSTSLLLKLPLALFLVLATFTSSSPVESEEPTSFTEEPTSVPTAEPTTAEPTFVPTADDPSAGSFTEYIYVATAEPTTAEPTSVPTAEPTTAEPTFVPTADEPSADVPSADEPSSAAEPSAGNTVVGSCTDNTGKTLVTAQFFADKTSCEGGTSPDTVVKVIEESGCLKVGDSVYGDFQLTDDKLTGKFDCNDDECTTCEVDAFEANEGVCTKVGTDWASYTSELCKDSETEGGEVFSFAPRSTPALSLFALVVSAFAALVCL